MLRLPDSDAFKILKFSEENIPEGELAEDGREREPHITVAYGFLPEVSATDLPPLPRVRLRLGKISLFEPSETRKSYVVKVEVISDDLNKLHGYLRDYFGEKLQVTFNDYKPHLTLAYCKPSSQAAARLLGNSYFDGTLFECGEYTFSSNGRQKVSLKNEGKS